MALVSEGSFANVRWWLRVAARQPGFGNFRLEDKERLFGLGSVAAFVRHQVPVTSVNSNEGRSGGL
jgi:hypothetical protein